jgi:hypothetical protein
MAGLERPWHLLNDPGKDDWRILGGQQCMCFFEGLLLLRKHWFLIVSCRQHGTGLMSARGLQLLKTQLGSLELDAQANTHTNADS